MQTGSLGRARRMRAAFAFILAVGCTALFAPSTHAADMLAFDTGPPSQQGYWSSAPGAQTFVATTSGPLTRVSVLVNKHRTDPRTGADICEASTWEPLEVKLHPAASDNSSIDYATIIAATEISSSSIPCSRNSPNGGLPVDATFGNPATVTAGGHYALSFASASSTNSSYYRLALGLNEYPDGDFWSSGYRYNTAPYEYDVVLKGYVGPSDTLAPAITLNAPQDGATFKLGQPVLANFSCADEQGGSGLASCVGTVANGDAVDTGSVGTKAFTVNTADHAGNTGSKEASYNVIYDYSGFFSPVDNPPVLNVMKGGAAVPVKFSLAGDQGLGVLADGYPKSQQITCGTNPEADAVEETASASASGLSYDAAAGKYVYVWKTSSAWARTCRQLVVKLTDGTVHRANFQLR